MRNLVSPMLVDTAADLATFDAAKMFAGTMAHVASINTMVSGDAMQVPATYRFVAGSTTPDNNQSQFCVVPGVNPAAGKWIRADPCFDLIIPITFALVSDTVLATVPAEISILPIAGQPFWEMQTIWAGGIDPRISITWSNITVDGQVGGILGGDTGDGTFAFVSHYTGTLGSDFQGGTGGPYRAALRPGATIIWQYIDDGDLFTSGTGKVHIPCQLIWTTIVPTHGT